MKLNGLHLVLMSLTAVLATGCAAWLNSVDPADAGDKTAQIGAVVAQVLNPSTQPSTQPSVTVIRELVQTGAAAFPWGQAVLGSVGTLSALIVAAHQTFQHGKAKGQLASAGGSTGSSSAGGDPAPTSTVVTPAVPDTTKS